MATGQPSMLPRMSADTLGKVFGLILVAMLGLFLLALLGGVLAWAALSIFDALFS